MGLEFSAAVNDMNALAADQSIRSCIVTGEGHAFSAGGDLAWLRERHDSTPYQNRLTMLKFYNLYLHIRPLTVPTIAAINGHAIGAGMCMTLGCDFRIASNEARLGFTFVKLGIHPGMLLFAGVYVYITALFLVTTPLLTPQRPLLLWQYPQCCCCYCCCCCCYPP